MPVSPSISELWWHLGEAEPGHQGRSGNWHQEWSWLRLCKVHFEMSNPEHSLDSCCCSHSSLGRIGEVWWNRWGRKHWWRWDQPLLQVPDQACHKYWLFWNMHFLFPWCWECLWYPGTPSCVDLFGVGTENIKVVFCLFLVSWIKLLFLGGQPHCTVQWQWKELVYKILLDKQRNFIFQLQNLL